jgi:hypothetical protein
MAKIASDTLVHWLVQIETVNRLRWQACREWAAKVIAQIRLARPGRRCSEGRAQR